MKTLAAPALAFFGVLIMMLALFVAVPLSLPVAAQGGPAATPTRSPLQILTEAQQLSSDAEDTSVSANNIVNNANNAVGTANLLLRIALGATAIGGFLVLAIALLGVRTLLHSLSEARKELAKARIDLAEMRTGLKQDTEQVHEQASRAVRALALMQLGEQQLERRNIRGALQLYSRAYELDPSNRATNYFLGELYIQDKQLEKGIEHLQRDVATGVAYAPAQAALGLARRLQGDQLSDALERDMRYVQAEGNFLKALQSDPAVLDLYGESVQAVLGGLYKREGRMDKAIYRYEEARKVTPNKSYPVTNLALLYYLQGNMAQAIPLFERAEAMSTIALEANEVDYWARMDRLTALLALGKTSEALEDARIVVQQVNLVNPLESVLGDLFRLSQSQQPPAGLDEVIALLQDAAQRLEHSQSA